MFIYVNNEERDYLKLYANVSKANFHPTLFMELLNSTL